MLVLQALEIALIIMTFGVGVFLSFIFDAVSGILVSMVVGMVMSAAQSLLSSVIGAIAGGLGAVFLAFKDVALGALGVTSRPGPCLGDFEFVVGVVDGVLASLELIPAISAITIGLTGAGGKLKVAREVKDSYGAGGPPKWPVLPVFPDPSAPNSGQLVMGPDYDPQVIQDATEDMEKYWIDERDARSSSEKLKADRKDQRDYKILMLKSIISGIFGIIFGAVSMVVENKEVELFLSVMSGVLGFVSLVYDNRASALMRSSPAQLLEEKGASMYKRINRAISMGAMTVGMLSVMLAFTSYLNCDPA
jgi:hypothetical protein